MSVLAQTGLSAAQLAQIPAARASSPTERTQVLALEGTLVVIKGQRRPRIALGYRILDLLAWLCGLPWLRGVALPTGAAGQASELRRLRALALAGVAVPDVLHVTQDYFVMGYARGTDLASMLPRDPASMRARWNLGLEFLRRAHDAGQCLSQAFARNLILADTGIVAVDFEDDPLQAMTLHDAQVRDWMAYLHSTVWMLPADQDWVVDDLAAHLATQNAPVRHAMALAAGRLAWLRRLPSRRERWGRDLVGLHALGRLLAALAQRLPEPADRPGREQLSSKA